MPLQILALLRTIWQPNVFWYWFCRIQTKRRCAKFIPFTFLNYSFCIMALKITDANFQAEVLDSGKVAVVDFWAEWCGPCLAVAPIIEELAKDYAGKAVIGKVDVDNNQDISMRYGIRNIPTILFIKNGQVADKQVGLAPRNVLEAKLKALL